MNFSTFICTVLGFQVTRIAATMTTPTASPIEYVDLYKGKYTKGPESLRLSQTEKNTIVNMLNINRNAVQASMMMKITWNNSCEQELEALATEHGRDWFFERISNVTRLPGRPGPTLRVNFLDQDPEFKSKFPGYIYLFRDTGKIRNNPISGWLTFRNNQKHCCNMDKKCSNDTFQNFESCCNVNLVVSQSCSWAADYLPRELIDNMQQICGIVLNRPGPFTPKPQLQKQVGFLYAQMTLPQQDLMYKKNGKPCSECPPDASRCVGQCTPKKKNGKKCVPALCASN